MNLWEETIQVLREHGKTWDDVFAVCGENFRVSKGNYEEVAKRTEYYDGHGGQEVACDLLIVGRDFWLERWEYDGAEGFDFKEQPKPGGMRETEIEKLAGDGEKLERMNEKDIINPCPKCGSRNIVI